MPNVQKVFLLTCCCDAHITANGSKTIDPLLKLYVGRKLMINDNIKVEHKIANGSMAKFRYVKLKNGFEDCFTINIHGHYVRCVEACNVQHIEIMLEGGSSQTDIRQIEISKNTAKAMFPEAHDIIQNWKGNPTRMEKTIQLSQFPFNIADARTGHKLQGISLEKLMVSNWSHTTNWIYVVLSHVRTLKGLFMRNSLVWENVNSIKTNEMREKNNDFLQFFRKTKSPHFQQ